jgi:hypothetical protein
MAAGIIRRPIRQQRNRRRNNQANLPQPAAPVYVADVAIAGTLLTLTLSEAVSLNGVPQIDPGVGSAAPLSAVQTAPNIVAITYSAAITGAETFTIVHQDPAIRSASGGYLESRTFAVT